MQSDKTDYTTILYKEYNAKLNLTGVVRTGFKHEPGPQCAATSIAFIDEALKLDNIDNKAGITIANKFTESNYKLFNLVKSYQESYMGNHDLGELAENFNLKIYQIGSDFLRIETKFGDAYDNGKVIKWFSKFDEGVSSGGLEAILPAPNEVRKAIYLNGDYVNKDNSSTGHAVGLIIEQVSNDRYTALWINIYQDPDTVKENGIFFASQMERNTLEVVIKRICLDLFIGLDPGGDGVITLSAWKAEK